MTTGTNFSQTMDRLKVTTRRFAGRLARRETVLAAVILAVPVVALAQPLGLLLWARMRILTSIPRTAMATEELQASTVPVDVEVFPDLPSTSPEPVSLRDPLAISRRHFPRSSNSTSETPVGPKSGPQLVDDTQETTESIRQRLRPVVDRLEVQGLMPGRGFALINGQVRRVGEEFPGNVVGTTFHLVEVRKSAAVVRIEGLEFGIRLDGGGTGSVDIRP